MRRPRDAEQNKKKARGVKRETVTDEHAKNRSTTRFCEQKWIYI